MIWFIWVGLSKQSRLEISEEGNLVGKRKLYSIKLYGRGVIFTLRYRRKNWDSGSCIISSTNLLSKGWNQSLNPDNLAPKAMVLNNMPHSTVGVYWSLHLAKAEIKWHIFQRKVVLENRGSHENDIAAIIYFN